MSASKTLAFAGDHRLRTLCAVTDPLQGWQGVPRRR